MQKCQTSLLKTEDFCVTSQKTAFTAEENEGEDKISYSENDSSVLSDAELQQLNRKDEKGSNRERLHQDLPLIHQ